MPPRDPKDKKPRQSPGSYRFKRGEKVNPESDRAPSSKPPASSKKDLTVRRYRKRVRGLGKSDAPPDSRRPVRSSKPPVSASTLDPRKVALQRRNEHYQEQGRVLRSMIGIIERIGGHDQLVQTLKLHADTKLTIAKGEVLSDKLKAEAVEIWRVLNENIHLDRGGKPRLTLPALSELVKALKPRTRIDPSFGQNRSPHSLSPREMERSRRYDEFRAMKGSSKVEGIDPKSNAAAYHALTMGTSTATGRNGIEKTLESAREKVGQMSEDQLAMVLLHYKMIKEATIRTYDAADRSRSKIKDILQGARDKGLGPRQMQYNLSRANVKLGMNQAAESGYDLAQMIVLTLKMTEQEAAVGEALAVFTTPTELLKLKKEIEGSMPNGSEKREVLSVIDQAIAKNNPRREELILPSALKQELE